jgi:hypothetical protein
VPSESFHLGFVLFSFLSFRHENLAKEQKTPGSWNEKWHKLQAQVLSLPIKKRTSFRYPFSFRGDDFARFCAQL